MPYQWLTRLGLNEDTARVMSCQDDSMEKTLSKGDEVIIDIRDIPHPVKSGVYAIRLDGHTFIKRLKYNISAKSYDVISDNISDYKSFTLTMNQLEDFSIIGKVVTILLKPVL